MRPIKLGMSGEEYGFDFRKPLALETCEWN